MRNLQKETEAEILAWIRSQGGNHRADRNSVGYCSYNGWRVVR